MSEIIGGSQITSGLLHGFLSLNSCWNIKNIINNIANIIIIKPNFSINSNEDNFILFTNFYFSVRRKTEVNLGEQKAEVMGQKETAIPTTGKQLFVDEKESIIKQ